jgi:HEAT repeat protein
MLPDFVARLLARIRRAVPPQSTRDDPRIPDLEALAATRDHRAVPDLLPLLVGNDALRPRVAATIAALLENVSPSHLAWLDLQARRFHSIEFDDREWFDLCPADGPHLCRDIQPHWAALGVLASHPDGHVREAAVDELGYSTSGVEIPFLAIRANDWVEQVAETAASLLAARLVRANRAAVLSALPFIVRMLGQRRRDHRHLENAFLGVLTADGADDVIEAIGRADRGVSRAMYELLLEKAPSRRFVEAALADADPVTRGRAVARLSTVEPADALTGRLAVLVNGDGAPAVRTQALTLLAERDPDHAKRLLHRVLFDPSAAVRGLARFLASRLDPAIDIRALYVGYLGEPLSPTLVTAVAGLGDVGTRADADRLASFLTADAPRLRRAALLSTGKLDPDRGLPLATAALEDPAGSVRSTARRILLRNAPGLDFQTLAHRLPAVADARARQGMLRLLAEASKWDAAVYLLEALDDRDRAVRHLASELLTSWVALYNRRHTASTPQHLAQIRVLHDRHASALRQETAQFLRSIIS